MCIRDSEHPLHLLEPRLERADVPCLVVCELLCWSADGDLLARHRWSNGCSTAVCHRCAAAACAACALLVAGPCALLIVLRFLLVAGRKCGVEEAGRGHRWGRKRHSVLRLLRLLERLHPCQLCDCLRQLINARLHLLPARLQHALSCVSLAADAALVVVVVVVRALCGVVGVCCSGRQACVACHLTLLVAAAAAARRALLCLLRWWLLARLRCACLLRAARARPAPRGGARRG